MSAKRKVIDMTKRGKKGSKKVEEEKQTNTLTSMFQKLQNNSGDEGKDDTKASDNIDEAVPDSHQVDDSHNEEPKLNEQESAVSAEQSQPTESAQPQIDEDLPVIIEEDYVPLINKNIIKSEPDAQMDVDETIEDGDINNSQILDALSDEDGGFVEGDDQVRLLNSLVDNNDCTEIEEESFLEQQELKRMEMYVFTNRQFIV